VHYIPRRAGEELRRAARRFPAVMVTGPRRAGKTTLLRRSFPRASWVLLEDPEVVGRLRADPAGFLDGLKLPVILDEVQNAPEVLNHVRARIDAEPRRAGRWLLTGSQESPLMKGVTESMAGRVAVLELLPLSTRETPKVTLLRGGFPEALAHPSTAGLWFRSYVQTYLERDVRAVSSVRDLATFRRFLALVASRVGQMLNKTDLAAPLGVSVPTIGQWLSILEVTGQLILVPPYFESFGKRLVKSPKPYFVDSGLACHLLGIESEAELARSPFFGPLFEGFVASEIVKQQLGSGRRRELYYFRDEQGLEVDFVVPRGTGRLALVEAKTTSSLRPENANSVVRLTAAVRGPAVEGFVVHRPSRRAPSFSALRPGVRAVSLPGLLGAFDRGRGHD
jgi:predicted AAA+ superfamily ATPase